MTEEKKFQFRVTYWNDKGELIKSEIQEVPRDGKNYHWSKVVKKEEEEEIG